MSYIKPHLIAIAVFLVFSVLTVAVSRRVAAPGGLGKSAGLSEGRSGGFALLTLDEAYPDREAGEALAREGIAKYVSESTQFVFLDDFSGIKQIPLDRYDEFVEPFDPRNDGYAEKLKAFFVGEGERRFFIPLASGVSQLESRIAAALGDRGYVSLEIFEVSRPVPQFWFVLLFAAAVLAVLVMTLMKGGFSRDILPLLALLPLQASFLFYGSGGFAFSACLLALFQCLLPPLREGFTGLRYAGNAFYGNAASGVSGLFGLFLKKQGVFKIHWLFAALFFIAACVSAGLASLHPLSAVLGLAAFFAILFSVLWAESNTPGHIRFVPLPIRELSFNAFRFPRLMIPFALASCVALFLPLLGGGAGYTLRPFPDREFPGLDSRDYEDHIAFQTAFSYYPLESDTSAAGEDWGYRNYVLGDDELIGDSRPVPLFEGYDLPAYPLADIADFLAGRLPGDAARGAPGDVAASLLVLTLAIPVLLRSGGKRPRVGRLPAYSGKGDRQVAA
jgi:hypothetical protein